MVAQVDVSAPRQALVDRKTAHRWLSGYFAIEITRWHPKLDILPPKDRGAAARESAVGFPTVAEEASGPDAASSSTSAAALAALPAWTEKSPSFLKDV